MEIISYSDYSANFDKSLNSDVALLKNIAAIKESIRNIMLTPKGTDLMKPDFGSQVYSYLFEPLDNISIFTLKEIVKQDIKNFEPRVTILEVIIESPDTNSLSINVTYKINQLNIESIVYLNIATS